MAMASAKMLQAPSRSTTRLVRPEPAHEDTIAEDVRMPSRPPNTIVFNWPPTFEWASSWPPSTRLAWALADASTSSAEYAACAWPLSTCVRSLVIIYSWGLGLAAMAICAGPRRQLALGQRRLGRVK